MPHTQLTHQVCRVIFCMVMAASGFMASVAHAETAAPAPLGHTSPVPPAQGILKPVTRSEDDLVLVDITIDGVTLLQSVPGYASKNGLILPLGQFTEAIEFPIKVSAKEGIADGWFYYEDNRFALDAARHEATVGGSHKSFDDHQVEIHADDIYVDTRLLEEWFALKVDFSFSTQTVAVSPAGEEKLPIQLATEFEKRKNKLNNGYQEEAKNYPVVRLPYQMAAIPYTDVSITAGYDGGNERRPFSAATSVEATGDLFYMTSDFFATFDNDKGISNLRWSLSRRDPEGELFSEDDPMRHSWLGEISHYLKLTDFTIGDVFTPALPLTANNQSGRGFFVSNQPYDTITQFDRTALEGDILPNWDVELFRNDELLAFQRAGADGRYIFTDVPLVSGLNIFRLVFHGPFGELREETRRIQLSNQLSHAGESHFTMSVLQEDTNLISMRRETSGSVGTDGEATRGRLRSFLDYSYGILDNLTFFGQLVETPTDLGDSQGYLTTGLGLSAWGIYSRVDASRSTAGGTALQGSAQTNLYGITLTGQHQEFDKFISDVTTKNAGGSLSNPGSASASDPLVRHSEVRADTPLNLPILPRLNLGFTGAMSKFKSGSKSEEVTQRLSTSIERVSLSNNISWENNHGGSTAATSTVIGDVTISAPIWFDTFLRGSAHYDVTPHAQLESLALAGDKLIGSDMSVRGEVLHDLTTDKLTTFTAGLNKKFEQFQVGINSSYDTDNRVAVFMNLTFSAGPDPRDPDKWKFFSDQTARDGLVSARTYLDRNDNGQYDGGDQLLDKAALRSDGGNGGVTDEKGAALLRAQRTTAKNNVTVDEESLGNPSWVLKNEGYAVITRPGMPVPVEFAVVESGSIDGTAYISKEDGSRDVASNVIIEMLDDKKNVVQKTRSTFDGYYSFEKVRIGHYALQVSPDQLKRRNLKSSPPIEFTIKGEESIISKADFILTDVDQQAALPPPKKTAKKKPGKELLGKKKTKHDKIASRNP